MSNSQEAPKVWVVYSKCGIGDRVYFEVVYVGLNNRAATEIAGCGGKFASEIDRWNIKECWQDGQKVSEICYDRS